MMLKRAALVALILLVAGGELMLQSATQAERLRDMDQALQDAASQLRKLGRKSDIVSPGKPNGASRSDHNSHEQQRLALSAELETQRFGPGGSGRLSLQPSSLVQANRIQALERSLKEALRVVDGGQIERRVKQRRKPDGSTENYVESEAEARAALIHDMMYWHFDPFGNPRVQPVATAPHPGTGENSPALIGRLEVSEPWHWTLWAEYPPETLASAVIAQAATLMRHPVQAMLFGLLCAGLASLALQAPRRQRPSRDGIDLPDQPRHAGDALSRLLTLDRENRILRQQMLDQGEQLHQVTAEVKKRRESGQTHKPSSRPA